MNACIIVTGWALKVAGRPTVLGTACNNTVTSGPGPTFLAGTVWSLSITPSFHFHSLHVQFSLSFQILFIKIKESVAVEFSVTLTMAEEASKTSTTQEEVVVADVAPAERSDTNVVVSVEEAEEKASPEKENVPETETEVSKDNIPESGSFKEESNIVSDLPETEKKALQELKQLIQEALHKHEFSAPQNNHPPKDEKPEDATDKKEEQKPVEEEKEHDVHAAAAADVAEATEKEALAEVKETETETEVVEEKVAATDAACVEEDGAKTVEAIEESVVPVSVSEEEAKEEAKVEGDSGSPEEVSIWGVPLLADEKSDVILLKFLRARDFKVKDAFAMIKGTIRWRKEFGMEELLEEELGDDLEKAVYMHGFDKEGHPVCYNVYGEFQNKELYKKSFSDEEKRHRFLRWRIQFLEKSIRKLDFTPGGISTIVQVNDLKNSPGPAKWELRQATKQALQLLQDNYPEFVAKQVLHACPLKFQSHSLCNLHNGIADKCGDCPFSQFLKEQNLYFWYYNHDLAFLKL